MSLTTMFKESAILAIPAMANYQQWKLFDGLNVNVHVHVYSPDIPEFRDYTVYTLGIGT